MARVQTFSESPISPLAQGQQPQALPMASDHRDQENDGQTLATTGGSLLNQPSHIQNHADEPAMEQGTQSTGYQLHSSSDDDPDRIHNLNSSRSGSPRMTLPPPPKAGEALKPSSYYAVAPIAGSQPLHVPRSASISPRPLPEHLRRSPNNGILSPTMPQDSALLTPKSAPLPRKSLEHPPGYVQNPYAADLTPAQRFATHHGPASPTLGYGNGSGNSTNVILGSKIPSSIFSFSALMSPTKGSDTPIGSKGDDNGEDWWSVVGFWAKSMGKKVGEVEGEMWRRINGENR